MKKQLRIPGAPTLWRLGQGKPPAGPHAVLVPGTQAPLLDISLPDKLRGAGRERVARRQLVEQLSMSPDGFEMHPYTAKSAKTWSKVVAVESGLAAAWRQTQARGSLALVPDYLALPAANGLWAIEVDEDILRARCGPADGFSSEIDIGLAQLAEMKPPKAVLRLGTPNEQVDAFLAGLNVTILTNPRGLGKAGFPPMRWADSIGGVNLKDPPSASIDRLRGSIRRWRLGIMAAVIAAAAWMGTVYLETKRAEEMVDLNRSRIDALVREHFVPNGPILDVRTQVGAAVEAAQVPNVIEIQGLPALSQFQIAAQVLTRDNARVVSASYRAETGLETNIEANDFAALDELVIELQDAEFLVEQLDSRAQQSGGVLARLRLELFE